MREYAPQAVVCTHFLPLEILIRDGTAGAPERAGAGSPQAAGREGARAPPSTACHRLHGPRHVAHEGVARYFVASEPTRLALRERGVPRPRVDVTGIPVRPEIAEAKAPRRCAGKPRPPGRAGPW